MSGVGGVGWSGNGRSVTSAPCPGVSAGDGARRTVSRGAKHGAVVRYVGGKTRIAKWVAQHVLAHTDRRTRYVEPFLGSGAVFAALAPMFAKAVACDAHEDLMLMWMKAVDGWPDIPRDVTRQRYDHLRKASPSAERGLVGFGASFGGKWFGGYANTPWDKYHNRFTKPYLNAAAESVLKVAPVLRGAELRWCDYRDVDVAETDVVYCDPPYSGTLGYGRPFDSAEFWRIAASWALTGAVVVVSEASAPAGWTAIATRSRKHMLQVAVNGENDTRSESLWVADKQGSRT